MPLNNYHVDVFKQGKLVHWHIVQNQPNALAAINLVEQAYQKPTIIQPNTKHLTFIQFGYNGYDFNARLIQH